MFAGTVLACECKKLAYAGVFSGVHALVRRCAALVFTTAPEPVAEPKSVAAHSSLFLLIKNLLHTLIAVHLQSSLKPIARRAGDGGGGMQGRGVTATGDEGSRRQGTRACEPLRGGPSRPPHVPEVSLRSGSNRVESAASRRHFGQQPTKTDGVVKPKLARKKGCAEARLGTLHRRFTRSVRRWGSAAEWISACC